MRVSCIITALVLVILLFVGLIGLQIVFGWNLRYHLHASNCTITNCQLVVSPEFGNHENLNFILSLNGNRSIMARLGLE